MKVHYIMLCCSDHFKHRWRVRKLKEAAGINFSVICGNETNVGFNTVIIFFLQSNEGYGVYNKRSAMRPELLEMIRLQLLDLSRTVPNVIQLLVSACPLFYRKEYLLVFTECTREKPIEKKQMK